MRPLLRICFLEFRVHQHNSNPRGPASSAGRGLPCISLNAVFAEESSVSKFVLILHCAAQFYQGLPDGNDGRTIHSQCNNGGSSRRRTAHQLAAGPAKVIAPPVVTRMKKRDKLLG